MATALPAPEVLDCYFDDRFEPRLPAMCLRWASNAPDASDAAWQLPEGVCLKGPAPERFGVNIQRAAADAYDVRLLWDRSALTWTALTRYQLLDSALAPVLAALGTDLWYLLEQPLPARLSPKPRAA